MKRVVSIIVTLFLAGGLGAQEAVDPAEIGFVRLISLAGAGTGNTKISIDGSSMWPQGFKVGQRTGGIGLKRGSHKFTVTKEGCKEAEKSIMVEAGQTQTLVAYAEPVRDEDGAIVGWSLKMARLSQHTPRKGMFMTLVCFCEEKELAIDVYEGVSDRRMKMVAPRLKAERIELGSGDVRAEVSYKGEALMTLKAEENGNYVVMIFEDGGKGKKAISFYDPKFVMAN